MRQMTVTYGSRAGRSAAPARGYRLVPRRAGGRSRWPLILLAILALLLLAGGGASLAGAFGGAGGSNPPDTAQIRAEEAYAQQLSGNSPGQQQCLIWLWNRESGWDPAAANPTSDARGIAQNIHGWGPGYQPGNWQQQIQWGLNYINHTSTQGPGGTPYGSPCAAWAHEQSSGWY
jgi:hypothetical protein